MPESSNVSMSASRATINTILRRLAKQRLIELRYRSIFDADSKRLR
jgi:DNA-binding GntR family transcriptional regulator